MDKKTSTCKEYKIPHLDCPTRWGSTYTMLTDIKISRDIVDSIESVQNISQNDNFQINDEFWNFVESYCTALNPLQKAIIKFQEEQLHYEDFYAKWLQCKLQIKKNVDENSHHENSLLYKISFVLYQSIEKRTSSLFDNPALAACLYLDPRSHHMQEEMYRNNAIKYLKVLWEKLVKICNIGTNVAETSFTSIITESDDILNSFLDQEFYRNNTMGDDVNTKIEKLNQPYVQNANVLSFWKDRKLTELYALSNVCFGVPPTQVSVERAFSSLKLVLADNRSRLREDTLENLLLVKLNPEFLHTAISELDLCADE